MKTKQLLVPVVLACLLMVPISVLAHHGNAAYDLTKTISAKATVVNLIWSNPHSALNVDIKDDKGVVTHWSLELHNPLWMVRSGWSKDTLKPGDEIDVSFHPAKNGSGLGYVAPGNKIVFHGQELRLDPGGY